MTETGTPPSPEDDARVASEHPTKSLKEAGASAEKEIGQDSSASEAIDRATAAVGKDEA